MILFFLFQLNFNFKTLSNRTFPQPFRCPIPHLAPWWGAPSTAPSYIRLAHLGRCWVSVSEGCKNYFGMLECPKTLRRRPDGNPDVKQSNRRWSADCVNSGRKVGRRGRGENTLKTGKGKSVGRRCRVLNTGMGSHASYPFTTGWGFQQPDVNILSFWYERVSACWKWPQISFRQQQSISKASMTFRQIT